MQDLLVALTFIVIVIIPALVAVHAGAQEDMEPKEHPEHRGA
jgi:hypothetical protein